MLFRSNALPVKIFLCPSRRSTDVGAKVDYASCVDAPGGGIDWMVPGSHAILPSYGAAVMMSQVTNGAGTSNTIMLAHKGLATSDYTNTSITSNHWDTDWADPTYWNGYGYGDHARDPSNGPPVMDPTTDGGAPDGWDMESIFTSAHTSAMPVLMGDASVRMYAYTYSDPNYASAGANQEGPTTTTFCMLFSWNRGFAISPP